MEKEFGRTASSGPAALSLFHLDCGKIAAVWCFRGGAFKRHRRSRRWLYGDA